MQRNAGKAEETVSKNKQCLSKQTKNVVTFK